MVGYQEIDLLLTGKVNLGLCKKELSFIYVKDFGRLAIREVARFINCSKTVYSGVSIYLNKTLPFDFLIPTKPCL